MKNSKKIIFIALGIVALVTVFILYLKKKKKPEDLILPGKEINPVQKTKTGYPLVKGSRGEEVKSLQKFLNSKHKTGLSVDGILGPKTEAALDKAKIGLPVTRFDFIKLLRK